MVPPGAWANRRFARLPYCYFDHVSALKQRASCTEACRSSCASALLRCPSLPCWFGTPKRRRQLDLARKHSYCRPGAAWSPMFCGDCQHMQKYKHQSNLLGNPHDGLETEDSV